MPGGRTTGAHGGRIGVLPPGWARPTDRILARLRARSIDERLLNGAGTDGDPVAVVRRARLISRRHRQAIAAALRKLVGAARRRELNKFRAQIQLRVNRILESAPLILMLADELEREESVSPRGVILA